MELELVLNELAMSVPAANLYAARDCMTRFVQTVSRAGTLGVNRVLRTHENFLSTPLAPNYLVGHWSHDAQADLDSRRYFLRLTTKAPFTDGLPELADILLSHDYLFEGKPAHGLGVASFIDGLAVSIDLAGDWDRASVPLLRRWITIDGGDLQTSEEIVPHASRAAHLQHHLDWIDQRLKTTIVDGTDLWQRRTTLFSGLRFCECIRDQVLSLTGAHIMLQPTIKRLFELDRYCRDWTEGGFDKDLIPSRISTESQTTLNEHKDELTFLCPDGVYRVFHLHARMTPGEWRLHFWPDSATRTILIGRIGKKPFI